jgi:hypothetical protein
MRLRRRVGFVCGLGMIVAMTAAAVLYAVDRPTITNIALVRIRVTDMRK